MSMIFNKIERFLKRIYKRFIIYRHQQYHDNFYLSIMKKNGIRNCKVEGEEVWLKKWSIFGIDAKPTQYRVFSHYIGANVDIVPEDICHDIIEPILDPFAYVSYYSDKNVFDKLFPKGITPRTILRKMNGFWYDEFYKKIDLNENFFLQKLESTLFEKIIVKPSVNGMSGIGVALFERVHGKESKWRDGNNNILTLDLLNRNWGDDIIVQEGLIQDDYISRFNSTSINTLRLSVYRSVIDDEAYVTSAIMRIGGKGSVVDNAHAGGCFVGIHEDGTFCNVVLDQFGQKMKVFNDVDYSCTFIYPNWETVLDFGKNIAKYVPHHRLLALDIALTKGGIPKLIEFNCQYYAPWPFQYTTGPAFGSFTDEIITYCKNRVNNYAS